MFGFEQNLSVIDHVINLGALLEPSYIIFKFKEALESGVCDVIRNMSKKEGCSEKWERKPAAKYLTAVERTIL